MNKELQDLAWRCLPKEFKEEVKHTYFRAKSNGNEQAVYYMAYLFDGHNLTSDAEGDENPPENCDNGNLISTDGNKQAEPKFKVGDIVRFKYCCTPHQIDGFKILNGVMLYSVGEVWAEESNLEPYTELKEVSTMKPIESRISVYLATKEEDEEFRLLLHENGFKWGAGNSLKDCSYWSERYEYRNTHCLYPSKAVTYNGRKTSDTLTFSEFKKQYFGEKHRNLSHETVNCDNQFDNILKDSFRNERRLNIAAMAMRGILSNPQLLKITIKTYQEEIGSPDIFVAVAKAAKAQADALLAECEK